jgi:hypothetical protein
MSDQWMPLKIVAPRSCKEGVWFIGMRTERPNDGEYAVLNSILHSLSQVTAVSKETVAYMVDAVKNGKFHECCGQMVHQTKKQEYKANVQCLFFEVKCAPIYHVHLVFSSCGRNRYETRDKGQVWIVMSTTGRRRGTRYVRHEAVTTATQCVTTWDPTLMCDYSTDFEAEFKKKIEFSADVARGWGQAVDKAKFAVNMWGNDLKMHIEEVCFGRAGVYERSAFGSQLLESLTKDYGLKAGLEACASRLLPSGVVGVWCNWCDYDVTVLISPRFADPDLFQAIEGQCCGLWRRGTPPWRVVGWFDEFYGGKTPSTSRLYDWDVSPVWLEYVVYRSPVGVPFLIQVGGSQRTLQLVRYPWALCFLPVPACMMEDVKSLINYFRLMHSYLSADCFVFHYR